MGGELESAGRELNGRFAKGNRVGVGNLLAQRTREMRESIFDCVTADQVKAVVKKMGEQAVDDGDVAAARVFLEYTCGKPAQSVELSGADGGPLGIDVASVSRIIMVALAEYPEARFRVASALREVAKANGDGGAGQLSGDGA